METTLQKKPIAGIAVASVICIVELVALLLTPETKTLYEFIINRVFVVIALSIVAIGVIMTILDHPNGSQIVSIGAWMYIALIIIGSVIVWSRITMNAGPEIGGAFVGIAIAEIAVWALVIWLFKTPAPRPLVRTSPPPVV